MAKETQVILTCPACDEVSLKLGDGDPVCTECDWTERAETVADSYARSRYPSWKHQQDGPEDEIGTCEACGYNAVAPLHESDIVGPVQQKLNELRRALDVEPGAGDAGYGLCFCCGEVSIGKPRQSDSAW